MSKNDDEFKGLLVLLVEDNPTNQFAVTQLLESKGIVVDVAGDGQQAFNKLHARADIQLVLMDVEMPVMDGIAATREIRRRWPDRNLPILALTATAEASDRLRCVEAGMNDVLAKPIRRKALLGAVREWLLKDDEVAAEVEPQLGETTFVYRDDLPDLPGIDINDALRRLGMPWEMLREMLIRMGDTLPERQEAMRRVMDGGDKDEIRKTAHSIAGAAGNAGAMDLYRGAKNLENAVKLDDGDPATIFADLDQEMTKVITSIGKLGDQLGGESFQTSDRVDPGEFREAFERLAGYLHDGDCYGVDETLDAIAELKIPSEIRDDFRQIRRQIEGLDFIAATEGVDRVRPRL